MKHGLASQGQLRVAVIVYLGEEGDRGESEGCFLEMAGLDTTIYHGTLPQFSPLRLDGSSYLK